MNKKLHKGISSNLSRAELTSYKNTLNLTSIQKDVIIGTLLGDSSMSLNTNKPVYSIKFEQKAANKGYVIHLYSILKPYVGTGPSERYIDKAQTRKAIWFRTYRHDSFIYYYNAFYQVTDFFDEKTQTYKKKGTKIVPKNIHKFLTARAVAYWFMDDGTYHLNTGSGLFNQSGCGGQTKSYLFSTQGFQKFEVKRLCDALKRNFDIDANVHKDKNYWRIYICKPSSDKFINLIQPYIHRNFYYKL